MRYPEPGPGITPMPVETRKPSKVIQVPVELYRKSLVAVQVPELTPTGAAVTRIYSKTQATAAELKTKAIEQALRSGLPTPERSKHAQKAARSRWSATGEHN